MRLDPISGALDLDSLAETIHGCEKCPRLRKHCLAVAHEKRRAYRDEEYWGRPISGFGDPMARVMIVGLAPAAHGANRTGRIFTGDRSGEWLYRALFRAGFANQPTSIHREDGLTLKNAYVTCVARCAPPENKPAPAEIARCIPYLQKELALLPGIRVFVALGQIGMSGIWPLIAPGKPRPKFGHLRQVNLSDGRHLILSYHPSQQNTFTGRLTEPMFDSVFTLARELSSSSRSPSSARRKS